MKTELDKKIEEVVSNVLQMEDTIDCHIRKGQTLSGYMFDKSLMSASPEQLRQLEEMSEKTTEQHRQESRIDKNGHALGVEIITFVRDPETGIEGMECSIVSLDEAREVLDERKTVLKELLLKKMPDLGQRALELVMTRRLDETAMRGLGNIDTFGYVRRENQIELN